MKIKEVRQNLKPRLEEQGWEWDITKKGKDFQLFAKKNDQALRMNLQHMKELFGGMAAGQRLTAWRALGDKLIFELEKQLTVNQIKEKAIEKMDEMIVRDEVPMKPKTKKNDIPGKSKK